MRQFILIPVLLGLLFPSAAAAQQEEPLFAQLQRTFKQPYLSFGLLVQVVGDFRADPPAAGNGFSLGTARLKVSGELDGGFGYLLQTDVSGSPAVLDARLSWRATPALAIAVGRFKVPFSGEFLTGAAAIDFVERSQAVSALAPNRQIGAQVSAGVADRWRLTAGAFNGNRGVANDNNHLLYAARLGWSDPNRLTGPAPSGLAGGVNVAVSEDDGLTIPGTAVIGFTGTRLLLGGDARWASDGLLVSGEVVYARFTEAAVVGPDIVTEPFGLHVTAGYMVAPRAQALLRLDRFDPDVGAESMLLVAGLNLWPTAVTELQVNASVNVDRQVPGESSVGDLRLLANFQVAF